MEKSIRLILVDDHDVVRTGVKTFLEKQPGLQVIGEAGTGEQALAVLKNLDPDVIVMDITMPGMDGLEATRRIKSLCPECRVLALTVHEDKQYFFEMLAAGASGYITKQAAADELVAAIRVVAQGHVYLQPALARWLLEDYIRLAGSQAVENREKSVQNKKKSTYPTLSKRELQVLELVAQGNTNIHISEILGISPKTVARHRERIMARLNLHSAAELVKYAIRSGLVQA
jgi:two-component system, NarL family, response regulator NreC